VLSNLDVDWVNDRGARVPAALCKHYA